MAFRTGHHDIVASEARAGQTPAARPQ
jgi:hypothetical protein